MLNINDYTRSPNDRWVRKNQLDEPILKKIQTMQTAADFLADLKAGPQTEFVIDQLLPDSTRAFMIICGQPDIGKTNL